MSMISYALDSNVNFKYYILLSGLDYPIKSNTFILDFLNNTDKNFIEYKKIEKSQSILEYFMNKQLWFKVSKWHFYDSLNINWNSKNGTFKHQLYRIYIIVNICFINLFFRKKKLDIFETYYFGSQWWILKEDAIKYVFEKSIQDKKIKEIFSYSDSSDEMYFQTILLNSKFSNTIVNNNFRYIDWDKKENDLQYLMKEIFEI